MSTPADPSESPDSLESPSEPADIAAPDESPGSASDGAPAETPSTDDSPADPRLNPDYVRTVAHPDGDVTLVGVVHDHPASVFRARTVVAERDPETVALELPRLAVPLYRAYARDSQTPPSFGGEMSAAAQAARERDAVVEGIDAPSGDFLARLARNCYRERASTETLRRVASGVVSVTRHAMLCRGAAAVADRTSLRVEVDDPVDHDCSRADPPSEQARDERRQVRRSQSMLRVFDSPRPVRLRDDTREESMAAKLRELRSRGDAVAVVGLDHLDGVAERLEK